MFALSQIAVYLSYASALTNLYGTFNITAPVPDQTYHINDTMVIQWDIIQRGLPRLAEMNIFLVSNNATVNTNYTVGLNTAQELETQQHWDYTIPSNILLGSYQLQFQCRERQSYLLVTDDITHIPIRIVQAVPPSFPAVSNTGKRLASQPDVFVMILPNLVFSTILYLFQTNGWLSVLLAVFLIYLSNHIST